MAKPVMKRKIGVRWIEGDLIAIDTTEEILQALREYGNITSNGDKGNPWYLSVDSRYNIQDVEKYIELLNDGGE